MAWASSAVVREPGFSRIWLGLSPSSIARSLAHSASGGVGSAAVKLTLAPLVISRGALPWRMSRRPVSRRSPPSATSTARRGGSLGRSPPPSTTTASAWGMAFGVRAALRSSRPQINWRLVRGMANSQIRAMPPPESQPESFRAQGRPARQAWPDSCSNRPSPRG